MKLIVIFLVGVLILSGCARTTNVSKYSDYPPIIEDANSAFQNKLNCLDALDQWASSHGLYLDSLDGTDIVCNGEECICQ